MYGVFDRIGYGIISYENSAVTVSIFGKQFTDSCQNKTEEVANLVVFVIDVLGSMMQTTFVPNPDSKDKDDGKYLSRLQFLQAAIITFGSYISVYKPDGTNLPSSKVPNSRTMQPSLKKVIPSQWTFKYLIQFTL